MDIFLSNPGFICAAGDSSSAEAVAQFAERLSRGERTMAKTVCGLAGADGERTFFVGAIDDARLVPQRGASDVRVLQILGSALSSIQPIAQKAVARYGAARVGVCIGSCDNGSERSLAGHTAFFGGGAFPGDYNLKMQGADSAATFARRMCGAQGVCLAFSTACSSGASAVIKARELIRAGICDAVVAGGVDIASDTVLLGFDSLEAVSHGLTNPFSKNRDGINLGEGAAVFVLSRDDIDGTGVVLAGAGESSDASHMTAPRSDGSGAARAMNAALRDARLLPTHIDYVNLHGTGTRLNDSMEAIAMDAVFGAHAVAASSTKPLTGHTLGAAGSLELAICFCALKSQTLPLHVWDGVQDDEIPRLNLVQSPRMARRGIRCCMSNSFAFGGCNASVIIKTV